jgi:cytochrome c oxidase assembly protein subunit 15
MEMSVGMDKWVSRWLFIGVVMILMQIFIGGITRLTGSGLSITKWEIVLGTLPPLNEASWIESFDLYKETPQYQKINTGMSLSEFKFIYFWEYFHRLWARIMGFVFIIPFTYFYMKGKLNTPLIRRLLIVILLAALVAVFGWIMVASGLIDRPWVNAYKLSIHLGLALLCLLFLFNTFLFSIRQRLVKVSLPASMNYFLHSILIVLIVQVLLGGVISGMRAALVFPTWPLIGDEWIPSILFEGNKWTLSHFLQYDTDVFMASLIHFLHRNTGYILSAMIITFVVFAQKGKYFTRGEHGVMGGVVMVQVLLGIFTLLGSIGQIPLWFGVFHQSIAFILLLVVLYIRAQVLNKD